MKETVLLTGGAGFIGSHVAVELLERGCDAVVADDLSNSRPDVLERVEKITGRTAAFYRLDAASAELEQVFREQPITAVIHLAGFKAVGESVEKPLSYYRNNLDITLNLLETMARHDVKRLIFSSSATVYGAGLQVPYTEDMLTGGCTNPYGWTKYMIEQILHDAAVADPALRVVCLRYFNPVGAHESGLIGEMPNGIPNNLMPYVTQTAMGIRQELSVFGNDYDTPDGTGVRDFIHVADLARGHAAALDYTLSHGGWEAINLGTGRGTSVLELVHAFEKATGAKVPYRIAPRRSGDLAWCYADVTKARRLLGWQAEKTIEDMCADAWRWQQTAATL